MLERKQSRKKEATTWDFTGIEPPSPQIPAVVEDRPNIAPDIVTTESESHEQEVVDAEQGKEPESSRLEFSSFEDQSLARQRSKKSKVGISAGDFSDITVTSPNKSDDSASAEKDDRGEVEK